MEVPDEVKEIVQYTQARECDYTYYESLDLIAWIKTDNLWEARKYFDKFYGDDTVSKKSRGNPFEIHQGGYFILMGFNFN